MTMAYNVYFVCDYCNRGMYWINQTVCYGTAVSMARKQGWTVGKRGWYCPVCKKKMKMEMEDKSRYDNV